MAGSRDEVMPPRQWLAVGKLSNMLDHSVLRDLPNLEEQWGVM